MRESIFKLNFFRMATFKLKIRTLKIFKSSFRGGNIVGKTSSYLFMAEEVPAWESKFLSEWLQITFTIRTLGKYNIEINSLVPKM